MTIFDNLYCAFKKTINWILIMVIIKRQYRYSIIAVNYSIEYIFKLRSKPWLEIRGCENRRLIFYFADEILDYYFCFLGLILMATYCQIIGDIFTKVVKYLQDSVEILLDSLAIIFFHQFEVHCDSFFELIAFQINVGQVY